MAKYAVCLTTVPNRKAAERIARSLVTKKLAACVNVIPGVFSFYRWKKKLCCEGEVILLMKTTSSKVKKLENSLKRIHPYKLPEFLTLPIGGGSKAYLKWLSN